MLFKTASPAFEKPIRDIFFCPVGANCHMTQRPKAMPWAELLLAFKAAGQLQPSHSPQSRIKADMLSVITTPPSPNVFRRICYPPAWSIRICYPINKEEPTPALPKGGSLNEAQYSLTTNRLTFNSPHPPSLGERLQVGELGSGNRRSRFACRRMGLEVGPQLRRICYPPER